MKILMFERSSFESGGGVNIALQEIANELRKQGHLVDILARNDNLHLRSFYKSYGKLKQFFKEKSKQYDVIHCHDFSVTFPAIKSGARNIVATFHGMPINFINSYFQNYCIKHLQDKAVVVSLKMQLKYPTATCIPNGINLDLFKRTMKSEKGLIGVAQKYNLQHIKKIVPDVFHVWDVPYEKMPDFYSELETFISMPLNITGFNMCYLEAMACEVPYIIGTNAGIGSELPIYKVKNMKELKTTLEKIKSGELKPLQGMRDFLLLNNFTWKAHVDALLKIYGHVATKAN